jgi:hypothetical protein
MITIAKLPQKTNGGLSSSQEPLQYSSTRLSLGTFRNSSRRSPQETVACHRACDVFHAAAVLTPDRPGKMRPLVKRGLVFIGARYVGLTFMTALMTRVVCMLRRQDA